MKVTCPHCQGMNTNSSCPVCSNSGEVEVQPPKFFAMRTRYETVFFEKVQKECWEVRSTGEESWILGHCVLAAGLTEWCFTQRQIDDEYEGTGIGFRSMRVITNFLSELNQLELIKNSG